MELKSYLKRICYLEQTGKETEMKISKHKSKKAETEKNIEDYREKLNADIKSRQRQIKSLTDRRSERAYFVFEGVEKQKKTTIITCVITVIIQALLTAILVGICGANNIVGLTTAYAVIYAIIIAIWLYFEYDMLLEFSIFKLILGVILLAIATGVTYWYLKTCNGFGINVVGANIIVTCILLAIEVLLGANACKMARIEQKKKYNENNKWLHTTDLQLEDLNKELEASKKKLVEFNIKSEMALAKMAADIASLEKFSAITQSELRELYAQNVLHLNYQNWVSAATIYEYLDVGRCYELKGPDGAYNLYEKELLAHKILDSLAAINSSINYHGSSLSNSQMYIRRQLSECNRNVERIVVNTYGL